MVAPKNENGPHQKDTNENGPNPPRGDRSGGGAALGSVKGKQPDCRDAGKGVRAKCDLNLSRLASTKMADMGANASAKFFIFAVHL